MVREAEVARRTGETDIKVRLVLDGSGNGDIKTGIGFIDHMLTLLTRHGLFDLVVEATGDLDVDYHHTVEDLGIVLGQAFKAAVGDKISIGRYGISHVPMDETLAMVAVDLSGRPFLVFNCTFPSEKVGDFDTELFEEFFRAFAFNAGLSLHINLVYGSNTHHMIEAIFKAMGRALDQACLINERIKGVNSTKGLL